MKRRKPLQVEKITVVSSISELLSAQSFEAESRSVRNAEGLEKGGTRLGKNVSLQHVYNADNAPDHSQLNDPSAFHISPAPAFDPLSQSSNRNSTSSAGHSVSAGSSVEMPSSETMEGDSTSSPMRWVMSWMPRGRIVFSPPPLSRTSRRSKSTTARISARRRRRVSKSVEP